MFFVKYVLYFTSEVDNIYISWVAKLRHSWNKNIVYFTSEIKDICHSWNINIVHFTSEIKDIFNKNIWIFFLSSTNFP